MATEIILGLISLAGAALGTFGGILVANRLVNYRLEQLEKKQDKHNSLIERMYAAETDIKVLCQRVKDLEAS
jgi:flagellar motor component MotA